MSVASALKINRECAIIVADNTEIIHGKMQKVGNKLTVLDGSYLLAHSGIADYGEEVIEKARQYIEEYGTKHKRSPNYMEVLEILERAYRHVKSSMWRREYLTPSGASEERYRSNDPPLDEGLKARLDYGDTDPRAFGDVKLLFVGFDGSVGDGEIGIHRVIHPGARSHQNRSGSIGIGSVAADDVLNGYIGEMNNREDRDNIPVYRGVRKMFEAVREAMKVPGVGSGIDASMVERNVVRRVDQRTSNLLLNVLDMEHRRKKDGGVLRSNEIDSVFKAVIEDGFSPVKVQRDLTAEYGNRISKFALTKRP